MESKNPKEEKPPTGKVTRDGLRRLPHFSVSRLSKQQEEDLLHPESPGGTIRRKPKTYKLGRAWLRQAPAVQKNLLYCLTHPDESGGQIVQGLPKGVSEYTLSAFIQAAQQTLYNQSVMAHNDDINSGFAREKSTRLSDSYQGNILVTLNDLCRLGFGSKDPSTRERREMDRMVRLLHCFPVSIKYPEGVYSFPVCITAGKFERETDKSITYHLILNPIFCGKEMLKNFGEFPQDATRRVRLAAETVGKRKGVKIQMTATLNDLMQLIGMQDKRKPFVCTMDNLVRQLGTWEDYRKNRKRISDQLRTYFDVLKEARLLNPDMLLNPEEYIDDDGSLVLVFHLNKDFCREATPPGTTPPYSLPPEQFSVF